ncbi:MAG: redoxin family protein [Pseudomonadota bacterium]|uniref:redoxin family protein n=1 Tax=Gallaecimonas pentaromativorans TaxID=584787 RepID=UPI00067F696A|nr:redoxin family protein [Gallaecimonas pentaromativorans]MED5526906.1 redoxin family protein [Pseudomonadota bacterium]
MKLPALLAACCLLLSTWAGAQTADYQHIALQRFPDLATVNLDSLPKGKPLYLKFWASWCKPCMAQMPHFEHAYQQYHDRINVLALDININERKAAIQRVIQRFGLTVPVWLDQDGALGVALGLVGTPYHVLIDAKGQVVYTSHEADAELDRHLALLADGKASPAADTGALSASQSQALLKPWLHGRHLLFFTATWCDWYLADTRPAMSQRCIKVQKGLAALHQKLAGQPWQGFVNHLWTTQDDVSKFEQQYQMPIPFAIDTQGVLFNHFAIRELPTLLLLEDGKVKARITDFDSPEAIAAQISAR